jgi:hypothetical protein
MDWQREGFSISTENSRLDVTAIPPLPVHLSALGNGKHDEYCAQVNRKPLCFGYEGENRWILPGW